MRESIAGFLAGLPEMEVCGVAANYDDALAGLAKVNVTLMLCDISLPSTSGLDLINEARRRWPDLRCIVLSGHDERAYASRAFLLGACGYVRKGDANQLREALEYALRGEKYPPNGPEINQPR